jgi:thiamine biosynthesis lipoprotein
METASVRRAQPLLGTFVEIALSGAAHHDLNAAADAAFGAVAQVHRLMSFHDPHSELSRLNAATSLEPLTVHPWTYRVLEVARDLHARSAGLFDGSVSPLLPKERSSTSAFPFDLLDDHRVRRRLPGRSIDLGGVAKGFAVDCAIDVLRAHGVVRGLVNAGGDLAQFGPGPEPVHLRDPRDPRRLLRRLTINDAALASSGRVFDPIHSAHVTESAVIDPRTGSAVHAIAGATVCAPTCIIADALTKVVMIAGQAAVDLLQHYRASALIVLETGNVRVTSDWQNDIRPAA